jgi:hypothetical protein
MRTELLSKYLSRPRYNRYLRATGNDKDRAHKLYNGNIRLAQAFHPILSQFEVVLRNSLNNVLVRHFRDPDWIITQKAGFMSDPSLATKRYYLRSCIHTTESKLHRARIPLSSGKIVSDQTLGFWTSFYTPAHYSLVGGQPIHVFANKPTTEGRSSIHAKLEDVQRFRNRVNHCEPICFNNHNIDCTYALDIRSKLFDLISWIEPELVTFFSKLDNTQNRISQVTRI